MLTPGDGGRPAPRVLATDLDGTFLAGSPEARRALTEYFGEHADRRLLYVTGRSSRSVTRLIADGVLPRPDAMICDVGAFVAGPDGAPAPGAVMDAISAAWGDRGDRVRQALADLRGLRLQDHYGPHRVGYYYDTSAVLPEAHARAAALGCDGLSSDNLYFDVLPRGVNKGTTLRLLMAEWGLGDDDVLVAGDTLNDLAMLTAGFHAVAVGDAEPDLLARIPPTPRIQRVTAPGCDGILDALATLGAEVPDV